MNDKKLFKQVFLNHHNDGQYYQLLDNKVYFKTIKQPTYNTWKQYVEKFDIVYGECKSHRINVQHKYFKDRLKPWDKHFNVFRKPLNKQGFDWLQVLHPNSIHRNNWGKRKVEQICSVTADISVNPVANSSIFFDTPEPRIHPGKNLISAYQILNKNISVIRFANKLNKYIHTPIKEIENITTLTQLTSYYKHTPVGFLEPSHIHMYCFHDDYAVKDINGYQLKRKFNIELFCEELAKNFDSNRYFPVQVDSGKIIDIPQVYDVKEITKFFQYIYKLNCYYV